MFSYSVLSKHVVNFFMSGHMSGHMSLFRCLGYVLTSQDSFLKTQHSAVAYKSGYMEVINTV